MVTSLNFSITAWISHFLAYMGGCFGCCTKPTPVIAVDEPSKGLKIQGRSVKKPTISDDFWSSSTCDLDNSTAISQRSISSISTSNQTINHGGGTSSSHPEFVNHGFLLWNQTRLQWTGGNRARSQTKQSRERRLSGQFLLILYPVTTTGQKMFSLPMKSWNATYESLLGTKQPFPHPLPLSEMIEFLVDVWELEGMYD